MIGKNSYEKIRILDRAISLNTDGNNIAFFGFILADAFPIDFGNWPDNLGFSANRR